MALNKSHIIKLAIALLIALPAVLHAQVWPKSGMQGDGSMANPWQIKTAEDLHALSMYVNESQENADATEGKHYRITNDIDLTNLLAGNPLGWQPIGHIEDVLGFTRLAFKGYMHGGGHVISGLRINRYDPQGNHPEHFGIGLFGVIENATIDSLGVQVEKGDSVRGDVFTGILVGYAYWNNTIEECYVKGTVSGQLHVGGMVGFLSGSHIRNCYAVVDVYGDSEHTGGLVGEIYYGGSVRYAYVSGTVKGHLSVGGITGYLRYQSAVVENVVAVNSLVEGLDKVGKVIGENTDASLNISSSYSNSDMARVGDGGYYAGVGTIPTQLTGDAFYRRRANWTGEPWNFPTVWVSTPDKHPVLSWEGVEYTHRITATAGSNGAITPTGANLVKHGTDMVFEITPNTGYRIDSVIINGIHRGAMPRYTFRNVMGDSSILVKFSYIKEVYTPKPPIALNTNNYGATLSQWILSSDSLGVWTWEDGSVVPPFSNSGYTAVFTLNEPDLYRLAPNTGRATVAVTVTVPLVEPKVRINGEFVDLNNDVFAAEVDCGINSLDLEISAGTFDTIVISNEKQNTYTWDLTHYGDNEIDFYVTTVNGYKRTFHIIVNKKIPFEEIVRMRWNNTLTVINNPANNGGFEFDTYKWFINGVESGTNQSWSAGRNGEHINTSDVFRLELTAKGVHGILNSCESRITLQNTNSSVYPNPVEQGGTVYISTGIEAAQLKDAKIDVYDLSGNLVESIAVSNRIESARAPFIDASLSEVSGSNATTEVSRIPVYIKYLRGPYVLILRGPDGMKQEFKIVVK